MSPPLDHLPAAAPSPDSAGRRAAPAAADLTDPRVRRQAVLAARRAAGRVAPVWPLKTFVAVNPYLGHADLGFDVAAERLGRTAGTRLTQPRETYLAALDSGRIKRGDVAAALTASPRRGDVPRQVDAFLDAVRAAPEGSAVDPLPTLCDLGAAATGLDLSALVLDRVGAWAAAYFDTGQAYWSPVDRSLTPYAAWRAFAAVDRTPEVRGLKGFRARVRALPERAEDMLSLAAQTVCSDPAGLEIYFQRLLMTVPGWAAVARQRVWQAALDGRDDDPTLVEFLAVRLAWDIAIQMGHASDPDYGAALDRARRAWTCPGQVSRDLAIDCILQAAADRAWQRDLAARLSSVRRPEPAVTGRTTRPDIQAVFCIDVRSEVFRRALESTGANVQTLGFAGFFGFPIAYTPLGADAAQAQCPVLLSPSIALNETLESPAATKAARRRIGIARRVARAWKAFKLSAVSSFAFVETVGPAYAWRLVRDAFGLGQSDAAPSSGGRPCLAPETMGGQATGLDAAARLDAAETALRAMSLTDGFARLVVLAGHGSTSRNNPHASGLDCGACGGHSGEANAQVAAEILNDPQVRKGLRQRGVCVPSDTWFLPARHDTTTDDVRLLDTADLPSSHAGDLAALREALSVAGDLARLERAERLPGARRRDGRVDIIRRSRDWSQVRPEWGLAGCAAFIAAPRRVTEGCDLGGRAFLHSYDWSRDKGFKVLDLIMTAPMIVASWINLQYYASTVDNAVFGSGNKTLHNVVGGLGVLEGNGGDLRTGLPWQSVHDGAAPAHEPLRLAVMIAAPTSAINEVIARHEQVRHLVDHGWLDLFALDESGRPAWRYLGGGSWASALFPETVG